MKTSSARACGRRARQGAGRASGSCRRPARRSGPAPRRRAAFCHAASSHTDRRRQVGHVAAEPRRVAPAVVGDPARCIQLDGFKRTHEGPAQAQSVADRVVEILRTDVAFLHEAERLGQQRDLQPVQDEAVDLALHVDRHLADAFEHRARAAARLLRGPRRTAQLDHRNQVRRIDRMGDDAARAAGELLGELRGDDRRRRRREHGVARRQRVHLRKGRALGVERLGSAFLDEVDGAHGLLERVDDRHARRRGGGIRHQPVRRQLLERRRDPSGGRRPLRRERVPDAHRPAGAREDIGPGAPDQSGTDDRCGWHVVSPSVICHSQRTLRRRSRSADSAREGPIWVTSPRSSTTVAVRQREREIEMVIDDQDGHMLAQPVEGLEQFLHDRPAPAPRRARRAAAPGCRPTARGRRRPSAARRRTGSRRASASVRGCAGRTPRSCPRPRRRPCRCVASIARVRGSGQPSFRRTAPALRHVRARPGARSAPAGARRASRPPSAMSPAEGGVMPMTVFSSVDLPAPLRPSSATISRSFTSKVTSRRMWLLP